MMVRDKDDVRPQVATGGMWDSVAVVWKHRRLIVRLCVSACLLAGIVSLLLPKEYDATASVLPPTESRGRGIDALLSQAGVAGSLGAVLQGSGTKEAFVAILKSRTMQDDIIKKFDLIKVYDLQGSTRPMEKARAKLADMTNIKVSRTEGTISVTATAYDPKMAADIANFYVDNLDRLNTMLTVTEAGRSRRFLEGRVAEAKKALRDAEEGLRAYQSRSKAVVMEGQTKAAIEGMARLEGQIQASEVQLRYLESYATPRNPDVIRLKESIAEMRQQLKRMEYGRRRAEGGGQRADGGEDGVVSDFAVPLGTIPDKGLELARLIRDAKIQETIFTLLTEQLERAKIEEAKDMPTVKILDRAVPPEGKARPSALVNTAIAGTLSLFLGVVFAFVMESVRVRRRGLESTTG